MDTQCTVVCEEEFLHKYISGLVFALKCTTLKRSVFPMSLKASSSIADRKIETSVDTHPCLIGFEMYLRHPSIHNVDHHSGMHISYGYELIEISIFPQKLPQSDHYNCVE